MILRWKRKCKKWKLNHEEVLKVRSVKKEKRGSDNSKNESEKTVSLLMRKNKYLKLIVN